MNPANDLPPTLTTFFKSLDDLMPDDQFLVDEKRYIALIPNDEKLEAYRALSFADKKWVVHLATVTDEKWEMYAVIGKLFLTAEAHAQGGGVADLTPDYTRMAVATRQGYEWFGKALASLAAIDLTRIANAFQAASDVRLALELQAEGASSEEAADTVRMMRQIRKSPQDAASVIGKLLEGLSKLDAKKRAAPAAAE